MLGIPALDVAIGLSFIYLLLGLICTTVNEAIAGWRKSRAKFLDKGIDRLLGGDANLKSQFYDHPAIKTLSESPNEICPSYIPADRFATALMDILSGPGQSLHNVAAMKAALSTIGNAAFQAQVKLLLDRAGNDANDVAKHLEHWFNDTMDRVSGWYKRHSQAWSLILACGVTLVMNADTVQMARTLWANPTVRQTVVEQARARAQGTRPEDMLPVAHYSDPNDPTEGARPVQVSDTKLTDAEQNSLGQLTGWETDWPKWQELGLLKGFSWVLWTHLLGWVFTAIAVSLGAPFWFDTLNRFMNIRSAGRAPDEKRDKSQ